MASTSRTVALIVAGAALLAATACTPPEVATTAPEATASCTKDSLPTRTPGTLTVATGEPAQRPWFVDDRPTTGEGFEAAVAYAVAARLGYARDEVTWTRVPADAALAPGPKTFDVGVDQVAISEERKRSADFSAPYYLVRQTVVAVKSSPIVGKRSLADLRDARLGARAGSTGEQAITDLVEPTTRPRLFDSDEAAVQALRGGQIDGLVVDLPTAFALPDTVVVGQLPQVGAPQAFGLLLDRDSPLTGCVSAAVGQLAADGTLKQLEQTWLVEAARVPELR
ncbi:amino acid ABC transporter substrate-binding protein, PAAT family (TC 3.A.1.3.-) [Micromonospora nigra]|uniref:Amino acid ABC transporter substrate-binding protein, PAAT family (TC 3.A.1.3.-) n=1 Tax=Micromonospora nigra TaxID=145857 RepID=A0A1C6SWI2_9ACTN|nr:transporter substrate-binding domain-containing protein [Micromonospora nigra]SCL33911.1 amino acid ABC transporter substrate-binding protein, PAAT family (TC 3.A.1.3.-) [Micromonospora nigra]